LVLLVHAFPEFWYSWRHQILPLADAGFRVVAPDTRGTNMSSRRIGIEAYRMGQAGLNERSDLDRFMGGVRAARPQAIS
jgi:pimeloyl-ACP methyl ester carboxylesterase